MHKQYCALLNSKVTLCTGGRGYSAVVLLACSSCLLEATAAAAVATTTTTTTRSLRSAVVLLAMRGSTVHSYINTTVYCTVGSKGDNKQFYNPNFHSSSFRKERYGSKQ